MKKILAAVLTLILALSSVCALAENIRWIKYESDEFGYSIEYPESWMALDPETIAMITLLSGVGDEIEGYTTEELSDMAADKNIVTFSPLDASGFNYSVDVNELGVSLPASMLAMLLCPEVTGQMEAVMPGVTVIEEGDVVTVNGQSFAHIHLKYEAYGDTYHSEQYYISNGVDLVTVTLTVLEEGYDDAAQMLRHALGTLSFK